MGKNIALERINRKIDAKKPFFLKDLNQEILDTGAPLRISVGISTNSYLGELVSVGALDYSEEEGGLFSPTEITDDPYKWKKTRDNPFTTAKDQDAL